MIRPFTCLCFLLACGSGLYLYQSKHRVQLLDRQIEDTVHATEKLREQTRVLHAEWTLLNDPQRLQTLADQFLTLKTVAPGQFTSMAELDNRLPAVPAARPPRRRREPQPVPVAQAPDAGRLDSRTGGTCGADCAATRDAPDVAPPSQTQAPPADRWRLRRRRSRLARPERKPPPRPRRRCRRRQRRRAPAPCRMRSAAAGAVVPRPIVAADVSRPAWCRSGHRRPPRTGRAYTGSALGMARSSGGAAAADAGAPRRGPSTQGGGG